MNICIDKSILFDERLWLTLWGVSELVLFAALVFINCKIWKRLKHLLLSISLAATSCLVFLALSVIMFFAIVITLEPLNDNNASYFFPLNAAIKNTCYLDPMRVNCPLTLDQVISIESENFKKYKDNAYLEYEYRPESHEYTLIALEKSTNRGAIFDTRFDFVDVMYTECNEEIKIKNPPPIDGIWNKY